MYSPKEEVDVELNKLNNQCATRPSLSYKLNIARNGPVGFTPIEDYVAKQKETLHRVFLDSGRFRSVVEDYKTGDIHIQIQQVETVESSYPYGGITLATFGLIPSGSGFSLEIEARIYQDEVNVDTFQYSQEGDYSSSLFFIFVFPFSTLERALTNMNYPGYVMLTNSVINNEEYLCEEL